MKQQDTFRLIIEEAQEEVIEKGTDNVSDRSLYLASLGWLAYTLKSGNSNKNRQNGLKGRVQQYSTPTIAGGGFVGLLLLIVERLSG